MFEILKSRVIRYWVTVKYRTDFEERKRNISHRCRYELIGSIIFGDQIKNFLSKKISTSKFKQFIGSGVRKCDEIFRLKKIFFFLNQINSVFATIFVYM